MGSSREEIIRDITRILGAHNKNGILITKDTDIASELNLDSLAVMDLMMELEEKFDVSIPLNLVPDIRTVADLAATIEKIKGGG